MSQTKLENFFNIKPITSTNKKYFIYSPSDFNAWFDYKPLDSDTFVVSRLNLSLYIRQTPSSNISFPTIDTSLHSFVPLLKSNLQKAVRRFETSIALITALSIIQLQPLELIRRLPIIYIEDVTLTTSYPVVIWLLIADKEHKLTSIDTFNLLQIVLHLCEIRDDFYPRPIYEPLPNYSHNVLQMEHNSDALLAVYYRTLYGGMKGDISMLNHSINYYKLHPNKVLPKISYPLQTILSYLTNTSLTIIPESIDFHCYPKMLQMVYKQLSIEYDIDETITTDDIKHCIWFCASGINLRKPDTIADANKEQSDDLWLAISTILPSIRMKLTTNAQNSAENPRNN